MSRLHVKLVQVVCKGVEWIGPSWLVTNIVPSS